MVDIGSIDGDRMVTIQQMVRNYYTQVIIVERARQQKYMTKPTDITLQDYLKGIGLTGNEMEYAMEYNSVIPENEKTLFPVT